MYLDQKFRHSDTAIARKVGVDVVILDMASGAYFGLDPIGARIWDLLGEQRGVKDACGNVMSEYDVSEEQLNADVSDLVNELLAQDLLVKLAADADTAPKEAMTSA